MSISENILIIVLSAVVGSLAGILTFSFSFKKEKTYEVSKHALTLLLQPLYISLKEIELLTYEYNRSPNLGGDGEYLEHLPNACEKLIKILRQHLYLGSDEMIEASIEFLTWFYDERSSRIRYEEVMFGKVKDNRFYKFRDTVYSEFCKERVELRKLF